MEGEAKVETEQPPVVENASNSFVSQNNIRKENLGRRDLDLREKMSINTMLT